MAEERSLMAELCSAAEVLLRDMMIEKEEVNRSSVENKDCR